MHADLSDDEAGSSDDSSDDSDSDGDAYLLSGRYRVPVYVRLGRGCQLLSVAGRSPVHVLVPVDVGLRFDTTVP